MIKIDRVFLKSGDVTLYHGGKKIARFDNVATANEFIASKYDGFPIKDTFMGKATVSEAKAKVAKKVAKVKTEVKAKAKRIRKAKGELLSPASKDLFIALANDAGNWSGTPLYCGDKSTNGNLTDLKRKALVTTMQDEDRRECVWVTFTDAGLKMAKDLGIEI